MSAYPLAFNIISDCWILFAVIWLVAAFWTKRRGNRHGVRVARISTSKIRRAWNPADHLNLSPWGFDYLRQRLSILSLCFVRFLCQALE